MCTHTYFLRMCVIFRKSFLFLENILSFWNVDNTSTNTLVCLCLLVLLSSTQSTCRPTQILNSTSENEPKCILPTERGCETTVLLKFHGREKLANAADSRRQLASSFPSLHLDMNDFF